MVDRGDVFDEIIAILTPQRLLEDPHATGQGVRLCIIDSGVENNLLVEKYLARGRDILPVQGGIFSSGLAEPVPYRGHQSSPHGTTVADIILTLAPQVQIFSADVFGNQGSCEVEVVINALHWAIDVWKCQIINLSL